EIRKLTKNRASLNDVMYKLYHKYYKGLNRGFTEAEFQRVCEQVAKSSLKEIFEYIYTTQELDYKKYLGYAGLSLDTLPKNQNNQGIDRKRITILQNQTPEQSALRNARLK